MRKLRKCILSAAALGIMLAGGRTVEAAESVLENQLPADGESILAADAAALPDETTVPTGSCAETAESPDASAVPSPEPTAEEETVPAQEEPVLPAAQEEETAPEEPSGETGSEAADSLSAEPACLPSEEPVLTSAGETAGLASDRVQLLSVLSSSSGNTAGDPDDGEEETVPEPAEPVRTDSVVPSGSLEISRTTADCSGTGWTFDADTQGQTLTDNSLVMVNAGLEKLTVKQDLTILAAGVNRILSLLLTGSSDVRLAGSGVFMIDSLACTSSFTGSFGLTEGGSAALFLKNKDGDYVLQNPARAPGILDEAYTLTDDTFIVPKGTSLEIPVTCDEDGCPLSVGSLTIAEDSTLLIREGGSVATDYATDGALADGYSEICVEGSLHLDDGAELTNGGVLYLDGSAAVTGSGCICSTDLYWQFPPSVFYRSDRSGNILNLKDAVLRVGAPGCDVPVTVSCSGACTVVLASDISCLNSFGRTSVIIPEDTPPVCADTLYAAAGCSLDLYLYDFPIDNAVTEINARKVTGEGSFALNSGILRIGEELSAAAADLRGVLFCSSSALENAGEVRELTGEEIHLLDVPHSRPDCGYIAKTFRSEKTFFITHLVQDGFLLELQDPAARPEKCSVSFTEPEYTAAEIMSALGYDPEDKIFAALRVVLREGDDLRLLYLTPDSDTAVPVENIVSLVVLDENCHLTPAPSVSSVSTNTSYTGTGILGNGGMISADGSLINLVITPEAGPEKRNPEKKNPEKKDSGQEQTAPDSRRTASGRETASAPGYYLTDMDSSGENTRTYVFDASLLRQILDRNHPGILIRSDRGTIRIERDVLRMLLVLLEKNGVLRFEITVSETGGSAVYSINLLSGNAPAELPEGAAFTITLPYPAGEPLDTAPVTVTLTSPGSMTEELTGNTEPESGSVTVKTERLGDFSVSLP